MDTIRLENKKNTKMIAHRGLSGIETENSYAAFVAAGNRDYYGVETDVHVTADGRYAVFHDDSTGRICGKNLPLEGSDFADLRALEMREAGTEKFSSVQKIPELPEYLRVMRRYQKTGVVELKNAMAEKDIAGIAEACAREYDLEKIIFISFCYENLAALRKLLPRQKLQYLVGDEREEDALLEDLRRFSLDLDIAYPLVTQRLLERMHGANIAVNCWTCDDAAAARRLIDWGVDMITTNILQ